MTATETSRQVVGRRMLVFAKLFAVVFGQHFLCKTPICWPCFDTKTSPASPPVGQKWTRQQWATVLFNKDPRFTLFRADWRALQRVGAAHRQKTTEESLRPLPQTVADLRQALLQERSQASVAFFQTLANSMPPCCQACVSADGGQTRF